MKNILNDNSITEYLTTLGEVKFFYIVELDGARSMVIHYVDNDDVVWCLMEEDEKLLWCCYEYLKKIGTPVLKSIEELEKYEKAHGIF